MAHTYRPQGGQASVLTFFFALCAMGGLVAAGSSYFQLEMYQMAMKGGQLSEDQLLVNDLRQLGVALGQLVLFIVTAVVFCVWVHQAQVNARALGATGMKVTPGWAVGSFFVPLVNLVMPFFAMVDLWKASEPGPEAVEPGSRAALSASPLLGAWWLTWLLGGGIGSAASMMMKGAADAASMARATNVDILASLVIMACALLAAFVVRDITWRQTQRHEALSISGARPAPAQAGTPAQGKAAQNEPVDFSEAPSLLRATPTGPDPSDLKPIIPLDTKKSA